MEETVKSRLKRLGIYPSQSLGQNFLKNDTTARRIVEAAGLSSSDIVLEIGPGFGVLTDRIVEKAARLIMVEKDESLIGYLKGRYQDEDIEVIKADVLELDLPPFDKVISNLPFSISSPVTFKLLQEDFDRGVLTYQKEFAQRMVAEPGGEEYSRLSVMVSTLAELEMLFDISRHDFYPPPRVDASVLRMFPSRPDFKMRDERIFSEVVKALFNHRRKKIRNSLDIAYDIRDKKEEIPYGERRVGNLSPREINEVVNYLMDNADHSIVDG